MSNSARVRPTVSVVIPCYNYGRFLTDCVESIVTQDGVDVRVLIIDDASTDDSAAIAADIAAGDPRVDLVVHDRNKGHIATYNEGLLEWADGDYSVLISADDKLTPGSLQRATTVLEENPAVGFTYGHPLYVRQDEPIPKPRVGSKPPTVWSGDTWIRLVCRLGHSVISTPEVVFRTACSKMLVLGIPLCRTPPTLRCGSGSPLTPMWPMSRRTRRSTCGTPTT